MEDLSNIRAEIKHLHERSQSTKTEVKVLQTKFDERHVALMEKIEKINVDIEKLSTRFDNELSLILQKMEDLNTLATQGKTSLRTLWIIGGVVASTLAFIATWIDVFK